MAIFFDVSKLVAARAAEHFCCAALEGPEVLDHWMIAPLTKIVVVPVKDGVLVFSKELLCSSSKAFLEVTFIGHFYYSSFGGRSSDLNQRPSMGIGEQDKKGNKAILLPFFCLVVGGGLEPPSLEDFFGHYTPHAIKTPNLIKASKICFIVFIRCLMAHGEGTHYCSLTPKFFHGSPQAQSFCGPRT